MTTQQYTSIPILLSKKQMRDLFETHIQPIEQAEPATLKTLSYLVSAIITQTTNLCIQQQIPRHLPMCITLTPVLPMTPENADD